ncbi:hypothetical protein LTR95_013153 [Oleoguttula sp. CCFEE 5521]
MAVLPDTALHAPSEPLTGDKRKREHDSTSDDEAQPDRKHQPENIGFSTQRTSYNNDDFKEAEDGETDDEPPSDDEDEDEATSTTYTEAEETMPRCAIYDSRVPALIHTLKEIPGLATTVFANHVNDSTQVAALRSKADHVKQGPQHKKIHVAILGNAGTGKSSLLNSIADLRDLAKAIAGGESCTCVPTEYSGPYPGQILPFAAVIEYYDPPTMKAQLQEIFQAFTIFACEYDSQWDDDTRVTYRSSHDNALKMFCTMFNDLPCFSTLEEAKAYLEHSYNNNQMESTIENLMEHCERQFKDKVFPGRGYAVHLAASTIKKLRKVIDPLMISSGTMDHPVYWPLVKRVCIYARGPRLFESVTVVDLPGISDTHEPRARATHEYIKQCDYIWAVAPISRVVDDKTIYQLFARYAGPFKGNVWIIATHADDGFAGHEKKYIDQLEHDGCDMTTVHSVVKRHQVLKKEYKDANKAVQQAKKRANISQQDAAEFLQRQAQLEGIGQDIATLEQQRLTQLVHARNGLVTKRLQKVMADIMPDGQQVTVHCVSNQHYTALKGSTFKGAKLSAEQTGVPKLREHALSMPALHLMRDLSHWAVTDIATTIENFMLWTERTTVERRGELLQMVQQPQQNLKDRIGKRVDRFIHVLSTIVAKDLHQVQESAVKTALEKLKQRRGLHPSTFLAFIRKNGRHSSKVCPKESWNEQFSWGIGEAMKKRWPSLIEAFYEVSRELKDAIIQDLKAVIKGLSQWPQNCLPYHKLVNAVNLRKESIIEAFHDNRDSYEKALRNILLDIITDSETNIFARIIKPIYAECAADSGDGVIERCFNRFQAHFSQTGNNSPFAIMSAKITKRLRNDDSKHVKEELQTKLAGFLGEVYTSVAELVEDRIVSESETAAQKAFLQIAPALQEKYEGAKAKLEEIKKKYAEPDVTSMMKVKVKAEVKTEIKAEEQAHEPTAARMSVHRLLSTKGE